MPDFTVVFFKKRIIPFHDLTNIIVKQICRVAGAGFFGCSRSRNFPPAPAPTPTLQYFKYFVFTGPKYDYKYDYDYDYE